MNSLPLMTADYSYMTTTHQSILTTDHILSFHWHCVITIFDITMKSTEWTVDSGQSKRKNKQENPTHRLP